jgi:flagellar basal body-associated protein FliL
MATNKKGAAEATAASGGFSIKSLISAVGIALVSALSSFVAIRVAMPRQIIVEKHIVTEQGKPVEAHGKEDVKHEEAPMELYPVGDFIVNLSDPGRHYLKTTIMLQMEAEAPHAEAEGEKKKEEGGGGHGGGAKAVDPTIAVKAAMTPFEPIYKDVIISTLSKQTTASLKAPGGKDLIKSKIKVALNQSVTQRKVMGVFFTDFVIQ